MENKIKELQEHGVTQERIELEELRGGIFYGRPKLGKILTMRLQGNTFDKIGVYFGVTRERIRQLSFKAIEMINKKDMYGEDFSPNYKKVRTNEELEKAQKWITSLPFSKRLQNILSDNNIATIAGLVRKSKRDILSINGMGEKMFEEITQYLSSNNLHLRG